MMMINRPYRNLEPAGFLFISLVLLALAAYRFDPFNHLTKSEETRSNGLYFQVTGDVSLAGTRLFEHPPQLKELLSVSREMIFPEGNGDLSQERFYSPARLEIIKGTEKSWQFFWKEIPAYQKMTLGIPLSLNQETEEGLTALPGIGPQTAQAIVMERQERGGFKSVDEIKAVKGVGERTWQKIKPFLTL